MQIRESEERTRIRRDGAREATALATWGRWEEAVQANQSILSLFPSDDEALNRLGKALSELGRYAEARAAFSQALEISPTNTIARKNLDRLAYLGESLPPKRMDRPAPHLFIAENGKTCVTPLSQLAPNKVLAKVSAGQRVDLCVQGSFIVVEAPSGEYVGQIEPRLTKRFLRLIDGGNRYVAAVASVGESNISVIIREIYQHSTMVGVVSFPTRTEGYVATYVEVSDEELEDEAGDNALAQGWGTADPEDAEIAKPDLLLDGEEHEDDDADQDEDEDE